MLPQREHLTKNMNLHHQEHLLPFCPYNNPCDLSSRFKTMNLLLSIIRLQRCWAELFIYIICDSSFHHSSGLDRYGESL
ncbi:hypothetical protein Mapa_000230 [Marchantia paleacea]|nr:hypothetical protein Mapa_000230 [Marchantia paleacea]